MFEILNASADDTELILRYIRELAIAEKFPFEVSVTKEDIKKNLFGTNPAAEALICYADKKPCGFAVFYHTFSTTTGKRGLHLDDFYVQPEFQGQGLGKKVLGHLAELAIRRRCARFEWWALKTNDTAIKFYKSIGARNLEEILIFRLDTKGVKHVATSNR